MSARAIVRVTFEVRVPLTPEQLRAIDEGLDDLDVTDRAMIAVRNRLAETIYPRLESDPPEVFATDSEVIDLFCE